MTTQFSSFLALPEEVISVIVSYVPDQALLDLSKVNRKLNRICSSPLELRQRCLKYEYWEPRHDIARKRAHRRPGEIDWRELFLWRYNVEISTTKLLDAIIEYPIEHIVRFNKIADFGYDAKDCLKKHAEVGDDEVVDPLARRWHATAAIRYIHRRRAVEIFKRIHSHNDVPLEVALSGLELFNATEASPDVETTLADLDNLAEQFLKEVPNFSSLEVEEKANSLIHWMWSQGFVGTPPDRYRALKNAYIGMTIRSVRSALPLTLVAIFCAIARRVGLHARACAYPGHVYAIVMDSPFSPDSSLDDRTKYRYYDLFDSKDNPAVSRESLISLLPPDEPSLITRYLSPSSTAELVTRMSQNIIVTLQLSEAELLQNNHGYPHVCEHSALYAALTAMVILGATRVTRHVVEHMMRRVPADFPMDVRFLEEEMVPRVGEEKQKKMLENVCAALRAEDAEMKPVCRRDTEENLAVMVPFPSSCLSCHASLAKQLVVAWVFERGRERDRTALVEVVRPMHRVGTIFEHAKYHYEGVIFGWSSTCNPIEGEAWIQAMDIDNKEVLPKGRKQPFYNVLVQDNSVRYVAQENILPIKPQVAGPLKALAGKYFKRFDPEEGRFVSNVRHEFPDD